MSIGETIRQQFTIRPLVLAGCAFALVVSYVVPARSMSTKTATPYRVQQVLDDSSNAIVDEAEYRQFPAGETLALD